MTSNQPDLVLANARLVLEDEIVSGSVAVTDGQITAIDQGSAVHPGAVDCEGDYVAPGLIELHTDNLERHLQPRPGVKWPGKAAVIAHDAELASTGITTVFDALRVGSIVSDKRSRYGKYARDMSRNILDLRAVGALRVSHFIHLRAEICSETLIEELDEFGPEDRIGIVSVMDHTPGQRQFVNTDQLRTYLSGKYGMSDEHMDTHIQFQIDLGQRNRAAHQAKAVAHAAELGAIVASHDDTTAEHVAQSQEIGVGLAEFPTTLEAAEACRNAGISVMMGAPNVVRGGSHSGNVAASALAERGLLNILSSDYVPASLLFAAVTTGEQLGALERGIRTVTAAPADAARLDDRGRIALGKRADFVRFTVAHDVPATRGVWVQGRRVA